MPALLNAAGQLLQHCRGLPKCCDRMLACIMEIPTSSCCISLRRLSMSSREPMPSSAAVRRCSSRMVRRGARLGTAPGATLSASCPAWSSRFVVCAQTSRVTKLRRTAFAAARRCVVWRTSSPLPHHAACTGGLYCIQLTERQVT